MKSIQQQSYDDEQTDVAAVETSCTQEVFSDSGERKTPSAQPPYGVVQAEEKDDELDFGERSDAAPEEAEGLQKALNESEKSGSCLTELSRITEDIVTEGHDFSERSADLTLTASPQAWDRQIVEPDIISDFPL